MATESSVTRSTVNKQQYAAPEFPTSGFDLSYSKHDSYIIGRIHASGYQWTMPSDKLYGHNSGDLTYNRIVTPMISPCDVGQYNFYIPLRALDTTFEEGLTPTVLNDMSANWHTPKCNTRDLTINVLDQLFPDYTAPVVSTGIHATIGLLLNACRTHGHDAISTLQFLTPTALYSDTGLVGLAVKTLTDKTSRLYQMADAMYLADALQDIADNITNKLGSADNPISQSTTLSDFFYIWLDAMLSPWVGRYSYLAAFGYNYLRPWDLYRMSHGIGITDESAETALYHVLDSTPMNEYPLRAMYAIWYERFRDVHIEPVSKTLPNWRKFGSTSIFDLNAGGNLCYLLLRIRSWYDDPYTSAQIDDISRHVYAPVIVSGSDDAAYHSADHNNIDTNQPLGDGGDNPGFGSTTKPAVYTLGYLNQLTGEQQSVVCPVPSNVNDVLAAADKSFVDVYGLDLNTLRQAQQLERYLKRNYLFGDEYKDRMLAHYNSRVSDMRINRPELIGQSINTSDMEQEVANVSTGESRAGDRVATSTVQFSGDEYSTFCEEFGIVVNILTIMPRAIYNGVDAHLLLDGFNDFPLPEFATNNEEFGRKMEVASSGLSSTILGESENTQYMFGRYPAYHIWRGRVDEVGGMFLDELQDCTFRRFWGLFSEDSTPKNNYWFLHCRPNLGMFSNTNRYDSQLYGTVEHHFTVERVLPTPVETI